MQLHDHHYRNLFRHPAMVRALFEGIIVEPWVTALDLDSLLFQLEHSPGIAQTQGLLQTLQRMPATRRRRNCAAHSACGCAIS